MGDYKRRTTHVSVANGCPFDKKHHRLYTAAYPVPRSVVSEQTCTSRNGVERTTRTTTDHEYHDAPTQGASTGPRVPCTATPLSVHRTSSSTIRDKCPLELFVACSSAVFGLRRTWLPVSLDQNHQRAPQTSAHLPTLMTSNSCSQTPPNPPSHTQCTRPNRHVTPMPHPMLPSCRIPCMPCNPLAALHDSAQPRMLLSRVRGIQPVVLTARVEAARHGRHVIVPCTSLCHLMSRSFTGPACGLAVVSSLVLGGCGAAEESAILFAACGVPFVTARF